MALKSNEKYLTLKEISQLATTPYATIKRDIEAGVLPAYKVGRKYFIATTDAEDYCRRQHNLRSIDGYTIREIMEIIPLSYAFTIELIRKGKLPAVKVGRQYIVSKTDFKNFLQEMKL
jgi:excisionase family DNA binding protein